MTPRTQRRRAAVLLSLAIACGGLAASRVQTRASEVEAQVGQLVPVVVTRADVPPGGKLRASALAVRQVPERFAPRDALASPEQALGRAVSGQSDLYSLGIVLFEMLTGDVPFKGENQIAVAMKHVRDDLPDLVLLDVNLGDASGYDICRAIKSDPNHASTIVVQISASFVDRADRMKGFEAGAD